MIALDQPALAPQRAARPPQPPLFGGAYSGLRVLVTGHTGFKGSWLALWLQQLGAQVHGLALAPSTTPNHWSMLRLDGTDNRADIRNAADVRAVVDAVRPTLVFHLAAQPLVRQSYADPLQTWSVNLMGTANLLDACHAVPGVQAVVAVTTDKVYENRDWPWGYREHDALGGHDPYSASKAATELVVASWRSAFGRRPGAPLVATARAGNVIGGGDWSADRLVPDLVRAVASGQPLCVRSPHATRPWQHVLDSLSGYLLLGQQLLAGRADLAQAFNFGPPADGNRRVADVLQALRAAWPALQWVQDTQAGPHEAAQLQLDSSLARSRLGWQPVWTLDDALLHTARWYQAHQAGQGGPSATQLASYVQAARQAGLVWAAA